jgi:hypothetical protein
LKTLYSFILVFAFSVTSNAQKLEITSTKRIDPSTIISSNYISVPSCSKTSYKSFDSNNPFTYLQSMVDENGVMYQMLYQTDFSDTLEYLSISNNANQQCLTNKKNEYCSCVNKFHDETFPTLQTSGTLDCVVQILKRCN